MYEPWPYPEILYYNSCTEPCDAWEGLCCCGATHEHDEFLASIDDVWDGYVRVYRFGKCVARGMAE